MDVAALAAGQRLVDAFVIRDPDELPALRSSAEAVLDSALLESPGAFFDFGGAEPAPAQRRQRGVRLTARCERASWELAGGYVPYGEEQPAAEIGPVHIEHWSQRGRAPRGTVIALHGFGMGSPRAGAFALFASDWVDRGLDVVLVTLPDHGARKPAAARFSGERFAVPNVQALGEAVRQAIYEVRLVQQWVRERSSAPVGLLGLSLGGYVAALFAGLYEDLDFVIPVVAPVCMGDLAFRFLSQSRAAKAGAANFSLEEMRASFWIHSPLAHTLKTERSRALIVAGRGDRVVPPEHSFALWRHWGEPEVHWFAGSHVAPFGRRAVVGAIEDHLVRLGIL